MLVSRDIARGRAERPGGMTLFKSMGMGLSDLAMAELILARAAERGTGTTLEIARKPPMARWAAKA